MLKKIFILTSCVYLTACGSMSVGPVDPYDDFPLVNEPMTIKTFIDPSTLNCSVIAPCNVKVFLIPSDGTANLTVCEITTQSTPTIITTNVDPDDYMLSVSGLANNYHPVYQDGNMIANEPGVTGMSISFESGIEYQQ